MVGRGTTHHRPGPGPGQGPGLVAWIGRANTATVASFFLLPTGLQAGFLQLGAQTLNLLVLETIFLKAASRAGKKQTNKQNPPHTNAAKLIKLHVCKVSFRLVSHIY